MAVADASVARPGGLNVLAARWQEFSRWWLAELRAMLPSGWLTWLEGEALPRLLMWRDRDLVVCRLALPAGTIEVRLPVVSFKAMLNAWLAEHGLGREQVMAGPVLGNDLFLLRDLSVPRPALGALPRILDQEVLRRTPFQLSDILHAAVPTADEDNGVLAMHHWIIRKDRAEAALAELGLEVGDIDFLATVDAGGDITPVIAFRTADSEDPHWARRAVKLLAIAALGFAIFGLVAFEWCQSSVANDIEASLIQARQGIQGGPDGINPAARLLAMKADVGTLEIWDELSRILPDGTFLTEIRIAEGKVTLSGFSTDAARLVRIIDKSSIFSRASLAAAITPDATEHKDRFSISFQVRGGSVPHRSGTARGNLS